MDETAKINTVLKGLLSNMTILASIVADPSKLETIDSQTAVADAHTQFTSTVQYLHDMVTKFSLAFKDAKKLEQCGGFADLLDKAVVGTVSSAQSALVACHAHTLLKAAVYAKLKSVIESVMVLTQAHIDRNYKNNMIPKLSGVVWQLTDELKAIPFNNKVILADNIKTYMSTMKDAVDELDEAQAEADEEDEVDDSDDELDMDKLSLEDRKVIPGCTLLIKTCGSLAGQVAKMISGIPDESTNVKETNDWLSKLYDNVYALSAEVDNMVEAVYPPQRRDSISESAKKLKAISDEIVGALKQNPHVQAEVITKLEQTVNMFFTKAFSDLGEN